MRMHTFGRTAVISGTALAMALGAASAASAENRPRHRAPDAAAQYFVFTKRHQSFAHRDRIGAFHAQVKLTGRYSRQYPMAWSFQITNGRLKAIARGNAVCTATGLNGRYHDRHVVPVGYVWHSTVRPHSVRKVYVLSGTCTFPVQVGGRPGRAFVGFAFHYAINPDARGVSPKTAGSALTTTVRYGR